MSRAQAAAAEVPDIENTKHVARLNHSYLRNDDNIKKTSSAFETLVNSNSSGASSSDLHDLILLKIRNLKHSIALLLNINDTSTTIANNLADCNQLRLKLLRREHSIFDRPKSPVLHRNPHALNVATNRELQRLPPLPNAWQQRPQANGWVQVGGRDAYPLPINSKLYVDAVTQVNPLTPENNPEFYKKLEKAILDETIQPEPVTISSSGSYHPTSQKPTQKTVKGRAGDKGGNKVTTRKHHHRHPTIHNVGHTVKVAHKPTDVNTIKTRRNHHAVKT